jgi:hypothetical protein
MMGCRRNFRYGATDESVISNPPRRYRSDGLKKADRVNYTSPMAERFRPTLGKVVIRRY